MKQIKIIAYAGMAMVIALCGSALTAHAGNASSNTSIQDIKQETDDLIKVLKEYSAAQRDEALKKTNAALEKLDVRTDKLEDQIDKNWDTMNKAARQKARTALKKLRKQRIKVAEWYGNLQSSSAEAWVHMKEGFSDAYLELSKAFEKSAEEYSSSK